MYKKDREKHYSNAAPLDEKPIMVQGVAYEGELFNRTIVGQAFRAGDCPAKVIAIAYYERAGFADIVIESTVKVPGEEGIYKEIRRIFNLSQITFWPEYMRELEA